MTDREKYIDVFKHIVKAKKKYYPDDDDMVIRMSYGFAKDILALLEEQEPVKPKETGFHIPISISFNYECKCGAPIVQDQPFCMKCGKAMIWDD